MRKGLLVLAILAGMVATPALAEQYWTIAPITGVGAVGNDLKYPQYKDILYIGFEDHKWLPEKCAKMPGLLMKDDETALMTMAMAAFENGRPVILKADDTQMIGEYCTVFQITLYGPGHKEP
jgi:hypothetical protein